MEQSGKRLLSIQQAQAKALHAGVKAVDDAQSIVEGLGYEGLSVLRRYDGRLSKLLNAIVSWKDLRKLRKELASSGGCLLQWPFYLYDQNVIRTLGRIVAEDGRYTVLLHDVNHLRYGEGYEDRGGEMSLLKGARRVIAHTEPMADYLVGLGVERGKIRVLGPFDYLTDGKKPEGRRNGNEVVFAGNLGKSVFLRELTAELMEGYKLNLYGIGAGELPAGLEYKGTFQPERVAGIEGSWGLVWDGTSAATCDGLFGRYLSLNCPHKFSLYISAHLPVVIWSGAALAKYVEVKGLGVVVNSLAQVGEVIGKVTDEDYARMQEAVKAEARNINSGAHLKMALEA
jgi:hypothetical protein